MSDKKIIVTLHGFSIKEDTTYEVIEKKDSSAPDGFKREGTTKMLSSILADNLNLAVFKGNSWDTGLTTESRALASALDTSDKKNIEGVVKKLHEYIKDPVEALVGKDTLSHLPDNKYWDEKSATVYRGKSFSTSNPIELLELFELVLHKKLAPVDKQHHPIYKDPYLAQFCIEDKEEVVDKEQQRLKDKDDAVYEFGKLIREDKEKLSVILEWLNIGTGAGKADDSALHSIFNRFIENENNTFQNLKLFLKAIDKSKDEDGWEEMYIHSKLKELEGKNKIKLKRREMYINDTTFIGRSMKEAASKIKQEKRTL